MERETQGSSVLKTRFSEGFAVVRAAVENIGSRLLPGPHRPDPRVQITPHESAVTAGEILWEDWCVDPSAILLVDGAGPRIAGHETIDLWEEPFKPLPTAVVELAKEQGLHLHFRAHPTANGLFFVEVA